ncbi:MAG: two-component system sensor histidine kinase NtrB [Chloroflexota bacterium]
MTHTTLLAYLLALVLIVGIGALALVQLGRISSTVDMLTNDLAVQRSLAKDIVNQVLLTRFYAHRYVRTQRQRDADRFDQEFTRLTQRLQAAEDLIAEAGRVALLARIEVAARSYETTFEEVTDIIRRRQRINAEVLDIQIHAMRDKLTALRVHSAFADDRSVFLAFGNAQDALEGMHASTLKFLMEGDPRHAVELEVAYQEAQAAFSDLETLVHEPAQRDNFVEAQQAATLYFEGVETIRSDQARLRELLTKMEDELEPEISSAASDIAHSVEEAFAAGNTLSQTLIRQAQSVLIFTTAVAVISGLGLGLVLARRAVERRRAHAALQESEERYRTLFEGIPVGLYRTTPGGKIVDANPALVQMLGYPSVADLRGTETIELYENQETRRRWQQALVGKGIVRSFEAQWRRHNGDIIWVRESARTVRDQAGKVLHYEGSVEDITKRKETQAALKKAEEQLVRREKLAMLGKLAGGVAHELRNPLGTISNAVYYLRMILDGSDEITDDYLNILLQEVENAEKIIADLLDFARIKSPSRSEVAVDEIVDQVLEKEEIPDSVEVVVQIPTGLPRVRVDPQQIEQVASNLITNAHQAMPRGGRLIISAEKEEGNVVLSIQDTGHGIPPHTMERLFEPLFTTKAKGIGLGLAISKHLLEANEGTIKVESEEGVGSTFSLSLPAALDTQAERGGDDVDGEIQAVQSEAGNSA